MVKKERRRGRTEKHGSAPFFLFSTSSSFFFSRPHPKKKPLLSSQASPGPARAARVVRLGRQSRPSGDSDAVGGRDTCCLGGAGGASSFFVITSSSSLVAFFFFCCCRTFFSSTAAAAPHLLFFPPTTTAKPVAPRRRRRLGPGRLALRLGLQAPRVRAAGREGEPEVRGPGAAAAVGASSELEQLFSSGSVGGC